ncbi:uncharacterized protein LOC112691235, partial [Sipha flava]|uniref:Uncharacterized protein LOC112691235 n=1 Tax=Sipha flava TaxID=143950 RepID=A0A8B8GEZ8_9HEMI
IILECCSKLERIASKRKIYESDSTLSVLKKDSKLSVLSKGNVNKKERRQFIKLPFIGGGSANKSHNIGITIQTTSAIIKQFPDHNYGEMYPKYSTSTSRTNVFPQFSDLQICPARSSEELAIEEDKNFDGSRISPWSVKQTDLLSNNFECNHQNNTCSCPTRFGDSYNKVMAPFIKNLKSKNKISEMVPNPYTKAKNVLHYESLSRHMQQLQLNICAMNNKFLQLTEKYTKLYQQHVRNENNNLAFALYATEDEIKALKEKVDEACDVYREASLVIVQQQPCAQQPADVSPDRMTDGSLRRDTTSVRLARVLHRIQMLQDKCKTGHFVQGCGDQMEQQLVAIRVSMRDHHV